MLFVIICVAVVVVIFLVVGGKTEGDTPDVDKGSGPVDVDDVETSSDDEIWKTVSVDDIEPSADDEIWKPVDFDDIETSAGDEILKTDDVDEVEKSSFTDVRDDRVYKTVKNGKTGNCMKKLTCEMCEGTDFVKQEGVFVCQSCGLKYSTEDAKKMMAVDAGSGATVVTADRTSGVKAGKLDNLYQLARRAKNEGDSEKAAKYYDKILLEEPNNWEAAFNSVYCSAIQKCHDDEDNDAVNSLINSMDNVMGLIKTTGEFGGVEEVVGEIGDFCETVKRDNGITFEAFYQEYKSCSSSSDYLQHNLNVFLNVLSRTSNLNLNVARLYYALARSILGNFGDEVGSYQITQILEDAVDVARNNPCSYALDGYGRGQGFGLHDFFTLKQEVVKDEVNFEGACSALKEALRKRDDLAAKRRFSDYWAAHLSEKATLESERGSLAGQIAAMESEILANPGYSEIAKFHADIAVLESERVSLGMFKFKEKKALQARIEAVNVEISAIQERIEPAIKKLKSQILELKGRIEDIDAELTKPR